MLTLTGQRVIADCTVYFDDVDILHTYVTPQSPRIGLDDHGDPVFSLVQYRRPVQNLTEEERRTRLGGGVLAFSVDLAVTEAQKLQIRQTLANDPTFQQIVATPQADRVDHSLWWANEINRDVNRLAEAVIIDALPVEDGSVAVAIEAEDAAHAGEFVSTLIGAGTASMTGNERAAFTAKLTQDGSVMLWNTVEHNLPAIWVGYQLRFTSRLDGVKMIVHCDAHKAFHAIQEQWAHINDNASWSVTHDDSGTHYRFGHDFSSNAGGRLTKTALDTEAAWVKVVPSAPGTVIKPELVAQLSEQGYAMIHDFLASTFLDRKPGEDFTPGDDPKLTTQLAEQDGKKYGHDGIEFYNLKSLDDTVDVYLDYTYEMKSTVPSSLNPGDNLANILDGRPVDRFRTRVDLDDQYYRYLNAQITCTANFDREPVDEVRARLEYHGNSPQGRIDRVESFLFRKDTPPQFFATYLAGPDQVSYDYVVDVFYRDSDKTYQLKGRSNDSVLVLDTDTLGILAVDVQLGIVDWNRVSAVSVNLSYGQGRDRVEAQYVLDQGHQSARWVEPLGRPLTEDYTCQITWVDKTGQHIDDAPARYRAKRLVVNQPLRESLVVTFVPAGSFGRDGLLSRIVVAARYTDPANDYIISDSFVMAAETDVKTWTVPLLDHDLRRFEYRTSVIYTDGLTREDETWTSTDKTVVPVGDPFGYRVQILPYLLRDKYTFGTLHVSFRDPAARITAEKDFEIKDFTQPLVWRFRLGAPERHTYQYQYTMYPANGDPVASPELTDSKEVLVLKSPV